jgi:hypothetical protein
MTATLEIVSAMYHHHHWQAVILGRFRGNEIEKQATLA